MVVKLLPNQVPRFWEAIKFAVVNANEIIENDRVNYLIKLLHSLLNDRSQCFVRFDEEKKLLALLVTKLTIDKITGEKDLLIQGFYSWKHSGDEEWKEEFNFIREFAEHEKCYNIIFESRNPRVWLLGDTLGFKESFRTFKLSLGGV